VSLGLGARRTTHSWPKHRCLTDGYEPAGLRLQRIRARVSWPVREIAVRTPALCVGVILVIGCASCSADEGGPGPRPTDDRSAKETSRFSPVLGARDFVNGGEGWGTLKPSTIYNGGAPSGKVQNIRWTSWGGDAAEGHGETFIYRPEGGYYDEAVPVPLRAYSLGRCSPSGPRAYLQLSVRVPSYPGGPFGPWERWGGAPDLCRWR